MGKSVRKNELAGRKAIGRDSLTYRGARRNNGTYVPPATIDGSFRGEIRPNTRYYRSARGEEFIPTDNIGSHQSVRTDNPVGSETDAS